MSRAAQMATMLVAVAAVAACGGGNGSPTTIAAGSSTAVTAPATPIAPTAVTGDQMCSLLGSNELAGLVYGKSSAKPSPETAAGLAGCRWPVSGVTKDFTVFIEKESGGALRETFGEFSSLKIPVKGQVLVRTTQGSSDCDAVAYGPQVPATYYLRIQYEGSKGSLKGKEPCRVAAPAVGVVLTKLGWAT